MLRKSTVAAAIAAVLAISTSVAIANQNSVSGTVTQSENGKTIATYHTYGIGEMPKNVSVVSYLRDGGLDAEFVGIPDNSIARVSMPLESFISVPIGEKTTVSLFGHDMVMTAEQVINHENGDVTWVARSEDGQSNVITFGKDGSRFGTFNTDGDSYSIDTSSVGNVWLIDNQTAGRIIPSMDGDIPKMAKSAELRGVSVKVSDLPPKPVNPDTGATQVGNVPLTIIDMSVAYSPELPNAITRINQLVSVSNVALKDSGLASISLRVLGTIAVPYMSATTINNSGLLSELTGNATPAIKPVSANRLALGADISIYVRPFKKQQGSCGVTYGNFMNKGVMNAKVNVAIVSDGTDGNNYCKSTTLIHEVGHLLGVLHDTATMAAGGQSSLVGVAPYAFGYQYRTAFGDLMSYNANSIAKFSSPSTYVTSSGTTKLYLGVEGAADATKAITLTAPRLATFGTATGAK